MDDSRVLGQHLDVLNVRSVVKSVVLEEDRMRSRWFFALAVVIGLTGGVASAAETVTATRFSGPTRYETAAAISRGTWSPSRNGAVLVRGDTFPDALVASHVAGLGNGGGPVLLTMPDELPAATLAELNRLNVQLVTLMGSDDAISAGVEAELRSHGFDTARRAGATRYDTAAQAVDVEDNGTMFLASGEGFADALAAGPLSFEGPPVVLTPRDEVHPAVRRVLRDRAIDRIIILGGTAAVSAKVEAELRTICHAERGCPDVERIAGVNRLATATKLADYMLATRGGSVVHVNLARADTFPDALAGGPHGGEEGSPILFAESPTSLGEETRAWLEAHADTIESIHVFGDSEAVSSQVVEEAKAAATSA